ncbi:MAG: UvrD-helicase domain-containing protein [Candidatus Izimaplasma sp.]|nr:UvrD-helicase domain-containing protein [Candidatus Izimaplasma bacterium]
MKILENLNEKQREAVLKTEGPVMAIAGAGSGKTSVLTRRIAHLIFDKSIPYQNILAITFTNKAANEMKERVETLTGIYAKDMWISTFHSMCSRILRKHIEQLGYKKTFQIIDDQDTEQLIKSLLKKNNYDIKMFNPRQLKSLILKTKANPDYLEGIEEPVKSVVKEITSKYTNYLFESNLVDFDDLLLLTIRLFKENTQLKKYYNDLFKYVLVDEFQDTNNVQYTLVKELVGAHNNLFIVGDEDQSIYAFRGANIENINKFKKDFPDYHIILLEQNYRSTNVILQAANSVIKNNRSRIEKSLYSTKKDGEKITYYKGVTARDEVEYIATTIRKKVRKGYDYNDFAILYRSNATSRQFEEVFMQKQIPYRIKGNTSFFKRKEIKDFTAYLRFIINPNDVFSFMRIVRVPRRGIGQKTIEKLIDYAAENDLLLDEAINSSENCLSTRRSNKLKDFSHLIETFKEDLSNLSFNEFVDQVLDKSGYVTMLKKDDKGDVRYENLMEFKSYLAENETLYKKLDKEEMLVYILEDVSLKSEETAEDIEDAVSLMTLHSAKGLEFKEVFLVTVEMNMFPLGRSMSDPREIEEERRLMYVGMTRAKDKLYITNANMRQTWGETRHNLDSPFFLEIPKEYIEEEGYNKLISRSTQPKVNANSKRKTFLNKRKSNLDDYEENDLNKGDKVSHAKFGDGVVISIVGDQCVIAFKKPHGIKKLMKNHPSIKKK